MIAASYTQFRLYIIKTVNMPSSFGKKCAKNFNIAHQEKRSSNNISETKQTYLFALIKTKTNCTRSFFISFQRIISSKILNLSETELRFFNDWKRICFSSSGHIYLFWSMKIYFNQFLQMISRSWSPFILSFFCCNER